MLNFFRFLFLFDFFGYYFLYKKDTTKKQNE